MGNFPMRILLASDGSAHAGLAADTAIELANETGSELHVVYVGEFVPPSHTEVDGLLEETIKRARCTTRRVMNERIELVASGAFSNVHARVGRPQEEISTLAEELGAGVVVLGSRGLGGLRRAFLGSVSDSVVRKAPCPVMVVRETHGGKPVLSSGRLLIATDGSEEAELALRTAADLAKEAGSELHVVTVGHGYHPGYDLSEYGLPTLQRLDREALKVLDGQVRKAEGLGAAVAGAHLGSGERPADEEIVALGEELGADLLVVGSRGLGKLKRTLIGSVSDSVVRNAHCPVLVVRQAKEACRANEEATARRSFSPLTLPCPAIVPAC